MADTGFFKGTSADQDRRFSDKELKLLKTMKFPPEFEKKVDMRKVNIAVIRPWIAKKIVELVGFEDEVVVEYAMGLLEDESQPTPDPKKMQINLTGFLTKDTPVFMTALWKLLLEAQDDVAGVPRTFVEEKKAEMRRNRENGTRAIDESDRRHRLDEIRDGERGEEDRETAVGVLVAVLLVEDPKDVAHALPSPVVVLALLRAHARSICAIDTDPHHRILVLVVVRLPATRTGISAAPVLHLRLGVDRPSLVRPRGPRLLRLAGVRALRHTLLHLVTATEDADHRAELEKRENELKEKALRNKVMKSRKGSN
ncbi:hypothetical protein C0989_003655 [Termitomyces sp. Mn162]|nr:hypothetical protein C0989_003655 [Termitomyces sp. Mn162]